MVRNFNKFFIIGVVLLFIFFIPLHFALAQDDLGGLDDLGLDDTGGGDDTGGATDTGGGADLGGIDDSGGGDLDLGDTGASSNAGGGDIDLGGADLGGTATGGVESEKSTYDLYYPGDKDPFFPPYNKNMLVVRVKKVYQQPKIRPTTQTFRPTITKPVIPDISMKVICIIGNDAKRMALVNFEGKQLEVTKGYEQPGAFKVTDITEDSVVVYSLRKKRQRIFKLPVVK